jgi:hypothetical protein
MGHFLETRLGRQLLDVIATIREASTFLAHGGDGGLAGTDAAQSCGIGFCF